MIKNTNDKFLIGGSDSDTAGSGAFTLYSDPPRTAKEMATYMNGLGKKSESRVLKVI